MNSSFKRALLAGGFLLASAGVSLADYNAGSAAFNAGDYTRAFQEFRQSAYAGNSLAQYMMGRLYAEAAASARTSWRPTCGSTCPPATATAVPSPRVTRGGRSGDGCRRDRPRPADGGGLACQPPGHRDGADHARRDAGQRPVLAAQCAGCAGPTWLLGRNAGRRDRAEEPGRDPRLPGGCRLADERRAKPRAVRQAARCHREAHHAGPAFPAGRTNRQQRDDHRGADRAPAARLSHHRDHRHRQRRDHRGRARVPVRCAHGGHRHDQRGPAPAASHRPGGQ